MHVFFLESLDNFLALFLHFNLDILSSNTTDAYRE